VENAAPYTKPFLKWAGNKFRIIDKVMGEIVANQGDRKHYVEPFAGSGAILINLGDRFSTRVYSDYNEDLVHLFRHIQGSSKELSKEVNDLFDQSNNVEGQFYILRRQFNDLRKEAKSETSIRKSALFIYLNRHCFNGLCRYGPNGFNVPFGRYKTTNPPVEEILAVYGKIKSSVTIKSGDFEAIIDECGDETLVYCDPPYFPLSATSSFTQYSSGDDFGKESQERLAYAARKAASRGAVVLISNHNVEACRDLYKRMANEDVSVNIDNQFDVNRFISAKGTGRGKPSPELIAVFKKK